MTRPLYRCGCGRTTTTASEPPTCDRCWCGELPWGEPIQMGWLHRTRGQLARAKRSTP